MIEKSIIEKPVSAEFICKIIGVTRPALHKWSRAGILRYHKLGGKLFYFESEVMEDMKKC